MRKIHEVVKVLDVEPFQVGEGDVFRFRLEILRELNTNVFSGKVYRLETYRLQPTFPQSQGVPPEWRDDGLIHVVDHTFDALQLTGHSADEVADKFHKALSDFFGDT